MFNSMMPAPAPTRIPDLKKMKEQVKARADYRRVENKILRHKRRQKNKTPQQIERRRKLLYALFGIFCTVIGAVVSEGTKYILSNDCPKDHAPATTKHVQPTSTKQNPIRSKHPQSITVDPKYVEILEDGRALLKIPNAKNEEFITMHHLGAMTIQKQLSSRPERAY